MNPITFASKQSTMAQTHSIFGTLHLSRPMRQILTLIAALLIVVITSCARKTEPTGQKDRQAPANPYTKKEFEKAKEIGKAIPIEKQ